MTLGNTTVRTSLHEKHLGNCISNNVYDRNIKEYVCRFIAILCGFGCCDSSTLVNIHRTFCMDLNGCELWNIHSKYTKEMHTTWRIAMRKIWKSHPRTHNNLICNIRSKFTHSLEKNTYFFHL